MSLTNLIGNKKDEYERAKDLIAHNPELKNHYDLDKINEELIELSARLEQLHDEEKSVKQAPITYAQYLELFNSLSEKLRQTDDMQLLDQILRKFFSNFTVKSTGRGKQQRCEIAYKLNEPWNGFVKSNNFDCGRG